MTPASAPPPPDFKARFHTFRQDSAYRSPWSLKVRLGVALWKLVHAVLWRPTPQPLNAWRLMLLRTFGARIQGRPYVSPTSFVRIPWQFSMEDRACLGDHAEVYNLGDVTMKARCTLAQHGYLCGGTHDLSTPALPLMTAPIVVGADAFIGAKALVLAGVVIGDGAVIGAGSVVTKDMPAWTICAGNPCKPIKPREWDGKR